MDRELLGDKGVYERNDGIKPKDDQDVREDSGTRKAGIKEEEENLGESIAQVVDHFFLNLIGGCQS